MELFESRYFSGQGKVYLADRDANGAPTGLTFIGDVADASLTPNVATAEVIENVTGAGGIGSSFTKSVEFTFSMNMRSIKAEHLALALQASNTVKASASVTTELHTVKLGKFSKLEHVKASTVVVTGTGGTPTYVKDTDYVEHLDGGMIEWLSGGTVTEDLAVEIDYDYADQHHIKSNPINTEKYLVFDGINRADNSKSTRCEIYKIKLDPSVLSLIQDEHAEIPISGRVLLDSLRAAGDEFFSWKTED